MTQHKYAEILMAIAEGKEVEIEGVFTPANSYINEYAEVSANDFLTFCNHIHWAFRIKPEPKPDVVKYLVQVSASCWGEVTHGVGYANKIKLTRSGETGELKGAEVIK